MAESQNSTTCITCKHTWTALGEAHCPTCHLHFGNVKAFDAHFKHPVAPGCLTIGEIRRKVTTRQSGEKFLTFVVKDGQPIRLNDPQKAKRLAKVVTPSVHVPEARSCDQCGRAMSKKPGRGRWPAKCVDCGGKGILA